jgi:SAM-dependent methyltransferase
MQVVLMDRIERRVRAYAGRFREGRQQAALDRQIKQYEQGGYRPWSAGYVQYRWEYIRGILNNPALLTVFQRGDVLPSNYGRRIDERVVEYAWAFSQLTKSPGRLLDAGSSFNFEIILDALQTYDKELTIITLSPEKRAFWQRDISYHYGDLRNTPFREGWFDEIVCLSTLEHVGMYNANYGADPNMRIDDAGYLDAMRELLRILMPGGTALITVPYGQPQETFWNNQLFMRQFDRERLSRLMAAAHEMETRTKFYRYTESGWQTSTQQACDNAVYFNIHETSELDPDYAAAARAVACIRIEKPA